MFLFAILLGIVVIVLALTSAMAQSSAAVRQMRTGVREEPAIARLVDRRVRHMFTMARRQTYFATDGTKSPDAD